MSEDQAVTNEAPKAPIPQDGRAPQWMLPVLLAVHVTLAGYYAFLLPLWGSVPDEPLHYSHMKYVAENWRLPVISNPFRDLSEYYTTADPAGTAAHGPVYYWTGAVIYKLTENLTLHDQQYVLRLYSVVLGALMVLLAWKSFLLIFRATSEAGERVWMAFAATALFCLVPHRLMISSVIYTDVMAATTASLFLYVLIRNCYQEAGAKQWFVAGLALGLALLTKQTGLLLVPGAIVALVLVTRARGQAAQVWHNLGTAVGGTLLVSGWWYVRNLLLYHSPFATEQSTSQVSWADLIFFPGALLWQVWFTLRGLWLSVWSQVGWLPPWTAHPFYAALLALTAIVGYGLVVQIRERFRNAEGVPPGLLIGFIVMALSMVLAALHWVMVFPHNNEETGKHAQTMLIALIPLVAAGWRPIIGEKRVPHALMLGAGLMLLFNVLSIYNLKTDLIPRYARPDIPSATRKVKDLPSGSEPRVEHVPDVPHRYQVHDYQAGDPCPQHRQGIAAREAFDADDKQQDQAHHRNQYVPPSGVELHVHGPIGPLMAYEDQCQQQPREVQRAAQVSGAGSAGLALRHALVADQADDSHDCHRNDDAV
ncbi:MAG: glycosyltransferase family 39 protein [Armatimonadia bacterium]